MEIRLIHHWKRHVSWSLAATTMAAVLGFCSLPLQAQSHWQDADLTALTGGALAATAGIATGFDPISKTPRTHYIGSDRHIHELYLFGSRWQTADLTALTGGANAFGTHLVTGFDPAWNTWRIHYIGLDSHIHELYLTGTVWQHADLSSLTNGPTAGGTGIATIFDPLANVSRTHYVASDQHVHELSVSGSQWQDADLTEITGGATNGGGEIATVYDPAWKAVRVHYTSADQHIHELSLSDGRWQHADLTLLTGGAETYGTAIAARFDPTWNGVRTHYVATDQHVHELFLSGSQWQDADLTALTGGASAYWEGIAICTDPAWNGIRTHYFSADRHVHELFLLGGHWQDADLTNLANGAAASYGDGIAMVFDPVWKGMRSHYIAADQHVHELFLVPAPPTAGNNPMPGWAQQAIDSKAAQEGLGGSVSGLLAIDSFTFAERFQNDIDVYWSLVNGAHDVRGDIKHKYDMWLGPAGFLGLPTTDETGTPDGIGRYNHFDNGSIYWTDHTGPMTVSGPIRDKWANLQWERGSLGYPVTDQVRWRTQDPATDQFIAWNLFENGAIVTTKNVTDVAGTAHITPDQLKYLVHRAVDKAVHELPNNLGLYPDIEVTHVSNWEYDFVASKRRAVSFKLHGFHDNGILGDAEFHFWFALRFSLSTDPTSFTDPWYRSLHVDLIPGSVGIDVDGISGWFASPDEYKQKIEDAFKHYADIAPFPVTTYDPATNTPHDEVKLIIIDLLTTASGGIDLLVSPEPPYAGTNGSYVPLVQQKIDDFIANF
jgi:LGFP repeat/Fungal fucose-specific lectin